MAVFLEAIVIPFPRDAWLYYPLQATFTNTTTPLDQVATSAPRPAGHDLVAGRRGLLILSINLA